MPGPALDLHEVLESEYVSMYGPLNVSDKIEIDVAEERVDEVSEKIATYVKRARDTRQNLNKTLNEFCSTYDGPESPREQVLAKGKSDVLSKATLALLGSWDQYGD